jgi:hypothetical protein
MNLGLGLFLGARGGGAIFDPSTVANMYLRYVAASAVVSSGVASVPNTGTLGSAAGANDLGWVTAKPTYVAADALFNSKPTVLHDLNSLLRTPGNLSANIVQPSTAYAYTRVIDSAETNNLSIRIGRAGSTANALPLIIIPSTDNVRYGESGTAGTTITSAALFGKHITCVVYDGASTALYVDDMTTPLATGLGGTGDCTSFAVGFFATSVTPDFRWSEQIVYGGSHNAATRALVKSYFTGTYG